MKIIPPQCMQKFDILARLVRDGNEYDDEFQSVGAQIFEQFFFISASIYHLAFSIGWEVNLNLLPDLFILFILVRL